MSRNKRLHQPPAFTELNVASDSTHDNEANTKLISTHARKVFDEMPVDLGVEPSEAHWTCCAKLHSVPVRGNKVKLETKHLDTSWRFYLVGHCFEIFSSKQDLVRLCESWNVPGKFFEHANGWFVFKFEKEQHREQVLLGGPYKLSDRALFLRHMPPCFEFDSNPLKSIPLWIKLPSLPLDCWNPTALSMIASAVGKPILTDKPTHTKERISYARLLVEVDGFAQLVTSIEIHLPDGTVRQQDVVYDGSVPKYCVLCHKMGHSSRSCTGTSDSKLHQTDHSTMPLEKKASDFISDLAEVQNSTCERPHAATDTYKQAADSKIGDVQFDVGDFVFAIWEEDHFPTHEHKLSSQKIGPLEIVGKINPHTYRLNLPTHVHISNVFDAKDLLPFVGDHSEGDETFKDSRANLFGVTKNDGYETALAFLAKHDPLVLDKSCARVN